MSVPSVFIRRRTRSPHRTSSMNGRRNGERVSFDLVGAMRHCGMAARLRSSTEMVGCGGPDTSCNGGR